MQQQDPWSSENFPETRKFWDLLIHAALHAPKDLRSHLQLTEVDFRGMAPVVDPRVKQFYLYRVLDEVQKAGVAMHEWKEFFDEPGVLVNGFGEEQLDRVILESMIDAQKFRLRKLIEVLTESVCFGATDSDEFYHHYFAVHELNEHIKSQRDLSDHYAFRNHRLDYSIGLIRAEIAKLETSGIDLSRAWYLEKTHRKPISGFPRERAPHLTTLKGRIDEARRTGRVNERIVLGATYGHLYSNASRHIHFSAGDSSVTFKPNAVKAGIELCGMLCHAIIIRCQLLTNQIPDGVNREIRNFHDENNAPSSIISRGTIGDIEINDIVWASGDLGEVQKIVTASTGYRGILVRYIGNPPIAQIRSDWYTPGQIHVLVRPKKWMDELRAKGEHDSGSKRHFEEWSRLGAAKLQEKLCSLVLERVSNLGLTGSSADSASDKTSD